MKQPVNRGVISSVGAFAFGLVVLVIISGVVIGLKHAGEKHPMTSTSSCLSQQLQAGSYGHCVRDAQTLVNFIETDGLTECSFAGGKTLPITGEYNAVTAAQIEVVQTWVNCYNKQEDSAQPVAVNGSVDAATWTQLCTYGYHYPSQSHSSNSPYLKQALAAGKDADC